MKRHFYIYLSIFTLISNNSFCQDTKSQINDISIFSINKYFFAKDSSIICYGMSINSGLKVDRNNHGTRNIYQVFVAKYNRNGKVLWQQNYGDIKTEDFPVDIIETEDRGFILLNHTGAKYHDIHTNIVKIDSNGVEKWNKQLDLHSFSIINKSKGNYIITGTRPDNLTTIKEYDYTYYYNINLNGEIKFITSYNGIGAYNLVSSPIKIDDNKFFSFRTYKTTNNKTTQLYMVLTDSTMTITKKKMCDFGDNPRQIGDYIFCSKIQTIRTEYGYTLDLRTKEWKEHLENGGTYANFKGKKIYVDSITEQTTRNYELIDSENDTTIVTLYRIDKNLNVYEKVVSKDIKSNKASFSWDYIPKKHYCYFLRNYCMTYDENLQFYKKIDLTNKIGGILEDDKYFYIFHTEDQKLIIEKEPF